MLSGCAAVYKIDVPTREVDGFVLVDARPIEEKEGKLLPFGRDVPISMYADSSFVPDRFTILKSRLADRFGTTLIGKGITVTRFRTLQYDAPRTGLDHLIFGSPKPLPGVPNPYVSWFIVEIELSVEDQRFRGRATEEIPTCLGCMKDAMPRAIIQAIDSLIINMKSEGRM